MDKSHVETDVISFNPVIKMSEDGAKMKCRSPIFLPNSFGNVRSRYLKEPIGSCHNLCKYGRKHESEHDEKRLTFRRFMADGIALEAVQNLVKGPTAIDIRKKMVNNSVGTNMLTPLSKHRRSISSPQFILIEDSRRHAGSLAKEIGLFDDSINIVSEVSSPTYKSIECFEKEIIPKNSEQKIQAQVEDDEKAQIQFKEIVEPENNINVNSRVRLLESKSIEISPQVTLPELPYKEINHVKLLNGSKNKKKVDKQKALSMQKFTLVKSNILKQKNSSASTEADSGGNTNIFQEKVLSSLKESNAPTTLEMIKQKNIVIRQQSASSRLQSSNQNASVLSRKTNSSATPAMPLNVRTPPMRSISQLNTSRSMNGRMNLDEKGLNSHEMPKVGETIPARGTVTLKARNSGYGILKNFGKAKDDSGGDFKEKILKVIEPKIDGKGLERQKNLSKKFDGHASGSAVSEASEHSLNRQIWRKFKHSTTSKEEDKKRERRTPAVQQPADGSSSSSKLKFKRGKVIELRTADSVVPKRLRFSRGRVLGENPIGEVAKRSFRRKRDIGNLKEHNSGARADRLKKGNLESKVDMLKYQDAHGKKEIRGLFNHVIEETASKLVETRKSKVKALVGAFETVISLQETKPASVA